MRGVRVMPSRIQIIPSLLASDMTRLSEQIQEVEANGAQMLHIDVMDGRFVPNITMGAFIVEAIRRITRLKLDVHLMIMEPERHVQAFADAGADVISVHYEASPHLHRTLQLIYMSGVQVGVAINPHTPAESLRDVMSILDVVNIMTVNPGFGGQSFIHTTLPKIARLLAMANDIKRVINIEVDGGINAETARAAVESGANWLVAGTSVFRHQHGIGGGMQAIRDALEMD